MNQFNLFRVGDGRTIPFSDGIYVSILAQSLLSASSIVYAVWAAWRMNITAINVFKIEILCKIKRCIK